MDPKCDEFKASLALLNQGYDGLKSILNHYIQTADEAKRKELRENWTEWTVQQGSFLRTYNTEVIKMLQLWCADIMPLAVTISDSGHIEINGSLKLDSDEYTFFPKLITKVTGDITLFNGIQDLENLRVLGGDIKQRAPGLILDKLVANQLIEVGNIYTRAQKISMPVLEYAGGITADYASEANFSQLKRLNGDIGMISLTNPNFPELQTVEGVIDVNLRTGKFRKIFPKLDSIGINDEGFSFILRTYDMAQEIEKLRRDNVLHFNGQVIVDENEYDM